MAQLLDGKALSKKTLEGVGARALELRARGVEPCLAVVLVGDDPASQVYVRSKEKRAAAANIETIDHRLPATTSTDALLSLVQRLNADAKVDGILVQLPLPKGIDEQRVLLAIDPAKDVDGFHPENLGRLVIGAPRFVPCTPQGCMRLIAESGVDLTGKRAVVIGRSTIVGKPMAHLLLQANATVVLTHSRTVNLADEVRAADVVIAAVGRAKLVKGDWIKDGAIVIDVGINRNDAGKLVGDVDFDAASERAGFITPVPGGVGPMTIACLLHNVVESAASRASG